MGWRRLLRMFAVISVVLTSCTSEFDFFERFVHPQVADVRNLKGGKFSCMHCPRYFRFDAAQPFIAELIKKHELVRVHHMPCSLEVLMSKGMESWWLDVDELPKLEKYWVEYTPKPGKAGESRAKLAIVRGQTVFWVTGGHFPQSDYEKRTDIAPDEKWCREPPGDQVMQEDRAKYKAGKR